MAFDLSTAKPVQAQSSGFDLSTAKPVTDVQPEQSTAPIQIGRTGNANRMRAKKSKEARVNEETQGLLSQFETGEITSKDLTQDQVGRVQAARIGNIPEITKFGIENLVENVDFMTALSSLAGVSTFNDDEFGRILQQADPNIGIVTTPEGERIAVNNKTGAEASLNKLGPSLIDAARGFGVASAFTPAGKAASVAPQTASRFIGRQVASPTGVKALAGAVGAGATETSMQVLQEAAGGEFDENEIALAAALGGGAELVVPAARSLLEQARGFRSAGAETVQQTGRRTAFETEGLTPTRAQVTRDATEFQSQQEMAKTSGPVRARLEQQEARLNEAFEQRAVDTGGEVITSTSTPIDEVLSRSITLDEQIGNLYRQAREAAPDAQNIRLGRLARNLQRLSGEDNISKGLISSITGNLRNRGIINANGRISGRVSVEVAEQIRKDINLLHNSVSDRGRQLSRTLKDSLDEDVLTQSGGDFFDQARTAKSQFEQGLTKARISKFDKNKNSLVRDMLENKIAPDTFINDVVFAKKWQPDDINQLRLYLNQTPSGQQAWNDIKAQTMEQIRVKSFTGPTREDGVTQSLSRNALDKTILKLGGKTDVIFNANERRFLRRLQEVAVLREPPPATFQGKGPSAQAVKEVKNKLPFVGGILDSLSDFKLNRLLLRLPRQRREARQAAPVRNNARAAQLAQQPRTLNEGGK